MNILTRIKDSIRNFALQIGSAEALGFVFIVGLLTTLFNYRFVSLLQIDMLPMIYREADPQFLTNDFFTNSSQLFNEDFVFARVVGWLGSLFGIPIVIFLLTLGSNLGISLSSYIAAKDLSKGNRLSGVIAALLMMSLQTFQWGNRAMIFRNDLTPEHLIMPLLILCIWQGLKGRIIRVGVLAAIATVIHPLSGPGIGGIMLLQIFISKLIAKDLKKETLLKFVAAGFLISLPTMVYAISYFQSFEYQVSDALFIDLMKMRFPHHYIPSYFLSFRKLLPGFLFITLAVICWWYLKKGNYTQKKYFHAVLFITAILSVFCTIGWFFAEVVPNRFIITLHLWRFLVILKILSLFGISLFLGRHLSSFTETSSNRKILLASLALLTFCIYMAVEFKLFVCFLFLIILILTSKKLYWTCFLLLLAFVAHNNFFTWNTTSPNLFNYFKPKINITQLNDPEAQLAEFIKENTPKDSRLLCGPRNGRLRILAERALVVDASGIPMNDKGLEEWWSRIKDVYCRNQSKKLTHIKQTGTRYNSLTDRDYIALSEKYDFDYVVVSTSHKSELKTLYQNRYLKLMKLP